MKLDSRAQWKPSCRGDEAQAGSQLRPWALSPLSGLHPGVGQVALTGGRFWRAGILNNMHSFVHHEAVGACPWSGPEGFGYGALGKCYAMACQVFAQIPHLKEYASCVDEVLPWHSKVHAMCTEYKDFCAAAQKHEQFAPHMFQSFPQLGKMVYIHIYIYIYIYI